MSDPVTSVTAAVDALEAALPGLLEACTDPHATDMAELLYEVQAARIKLQGLERDVEGQCAKAMLDPQVLTPTLRVERYRSAERKTWQHEEWQRDVRNKALRSVGLAGMQGVLDAQGEVLDPSVLHEVLTRVQEAHSAGAPKTTTLRKLGLDPDDYCERSPGVWHVKVQRLADESVEVAS